MTETEQDRWKERSAKWAATAARGRSADDSFNRMIIAEAAIRPGEDILDIASGTGDPAITIALALDGNGSVTVCDFTPRMVETARGRADNLDIDRFNCVAGDMTALPFADGMFDCVTCRFGLHIPDDRAAAAGEALRVLRPGGRAAYVVWGAYDENPPFYVVRRTLAQFFGEDEGPPPARHCLGAPGQLGDILRAAGFEAVEERELRYRRPVEDLEAYVDRNLKRSHSDILESLDAQGVGRLKQALFAAYEPFREDGMVRMPNYARLGLGWKAG